MVSGALILPAIPPFELEAVVRSHGWGQLPPLDYAPGDAPGDAYPILSTVLRLDSEDATPFVTEIRIRPTPEEEEPGVVVESDIPDDPRMIAALKERIAWMLALEQDMSELYHAIRNEPKLAHVEPQAQGRILRSPTLFEDVVKTILTTNTSWDGTIRMTEALVAQLGSPLPDNPNRHAFPTPEQIAAVDELFLREETRLGYRAPRILALARDVAAGDLDLEALKHPSLKSEDVREALLAIKGVGPYAAASLMAMLGHFDDVPVDSWARTQVSRSLYDGEPVTDAQVREAFSAWGEWQALAYWFWKWEDED